MSAVVILAAGQGSRMNLFTRAIPKALVPMPPAETLLDYHLQRALPFGLPVFVVCRYAEDQIADLIARRYKGQNVRVVHQESALGTAADGLLAVEYLVGQDLVLVHGDHFFSDNPFISLIDGHTPGRITLAIVPEGERRSLCYGFPCAWEDTTRAAYPFERRPGLRDTVLVDGAMVLPAGIFDHIHRVKVELGHVVEMRDVLERLSKHGVLRMEAVELSGWYSNINDVRTYCATLMMLDDAFRGIATCHVAVA